MPHSPDHSHTTELAGLLDLDGEVLHGYLQDVTGWVADLVVRPPTRILDLGAGTGAGTEAWAERFPAAQVVALDRSEQLLDQVRARVAPLADRVTTVLADIDGSWPTLEPVDLVWMSMVLHEMSDPDGLLRHLHGIVPPGGLVAVVEMDDLPRFLPDDIGRGRPGLEERCHQALADQTSPAVAHPDWEPRLVQAGFSMVARRTFHVDLAPPGPAASGRYARASLQRLIPHLRDRLGADDLAALDVLLASDGPDSLLHRSDLHVRTARTAWVVRRG